jgi:hypothetical protein
MFIPILSSYYINKNMIVKIETCEYYKQEKPYKLYLTLITEDVETLTFSTEEDRKKYCDKFLFNS